MPNKNEKGCASSSGLLLPFTFAVFVAILFDGVRPTTAQIPGGGKAAACNSACGCAIKLEKWRLAYSSEEEKAHRQLNNNKQAFHVLQAALPSLPKETKRKAIPGLAAGANLIYKCEQALNSRKAQETELQDAVAEAKLILDKLHDVNDNDGELKIPWTSGANIQHAKLTKANLGNVKQSRNCNEQAAESAISMKRTTEKNELKVPDLLNQLEITNYCQSSGGVPCATTGGFLQNDYLTYKLKLTKGQPAISGTPAAFTSHRSTPGSASVANFGLATTEVTRANAAIAAMRQTDDLAICLKDIKKLADISTNTQFRLFVLKALANKPTTEKTSGDDGASIAAAVTNAYGAGGAEFTNNVWNKIEEATLPTQEGERETSKDLKTLTTLDQRANGLARLFLKELTDEETKQKAKQKVDEGKEKECSSKKETECTGDCELEDGVCKPVKKGEAENKEKDGKAASTCAGKKQVECKDSSFFANQKFSLIAASFVSSVSF
ncbi:uncharacterized protein TEOVI_000523600 [Trypanosoma equiperdum]|uniref:Variant surface glycoprotein (VSG) n=1 Tax=Trypanosoma equiperdum TaxID=5694 RepID=A0A1G4IAD0_TRYEQ|nr:hypothetical protein, conserved [Trypanosoma equiperdum]